MTIPNHPALRRAIPACLLFALLAAAEQLLGEALGDHLIAAMLLLIGAVVALGVVAPVSGGRS